MMFLRSIFAMFLFLICERPNLAQILKRSIANTNGMKEATSSFSMQRANDSKALVQISRELDRPGLLGVITFILPLVIDSIFNKMAPRLFSPNTIAMLQKRENTFCGIRRRKRLERLGQFTTLATLFSTLVFGIKQFIRMLSRVTGKRNTTVTISLVGFAVAIAFVKKVAIFLVPGLAPADVLNKATNSGMIDAVEEPAMNSFATSSGSGDGI